MKSKAGLGQLSLFTEVKETTTEVDISPCSLFEILAKIKQRNESLFLKEEVKISPKSPKSPKSPDKNQIINLLRKRAQSVEHSANNISTVVSGNWTYKRQGEADRRAKKKDKLERVSRILYALATAWEYDNIPDCLKHIRNAADIELIDVYQFPRPITEDDPEWYKKEYPVKLKKFNRLGIFNKEEANEVSLYLDRYGAKYIDPETQRLIDISEKMKKVRMSNIPGFFPTPDDLIDVMIDNAKLEDGMTLLEPSVGIGSIPDRLQYRGYKLYIDCVEQQHSLVEILSLKGYNAVQYDILEWNPIVTAYDRILMNPPFEKGQDVQHITHCFNNFLKPGGILVAIASAGVMHNTQKKYEDFRDLIRYNRGYVKENGQAFKNAFNSTGTSTVTIVLTKLEK